MRAKLPAMLLFAAGGLSCELPPTTRSADAGPDAGSDAICLGCHDDVATAWANPSSHSVLLSCSSCHDGGQADAGAGHATSAECAACHSERAHQDAECTTCHSPHGSTNAFLIVGRLALPGGGEAEIHVAMPEGAGPDGLVHAGVSGLEAGTGLCEVCHAGTRYYDRAGEGEPHEPGWCGGCHDHQIGFQPTGR